MSRKLAVIPVIALAVPAGALAKTAATTKPVGNARLTVYGPRHVKGDWVGSASVKAPSAESLELQVCVQSNGRTVKTSCRYAHTHTAALALVSRKTHASNVRTWAWADVAGHTTTAVS